MLDGGGPGFFFCNFMATSAKVSSCFLRPNDGLPKLLHLCPRKIPNRLYYPKFCTNPSSHLNLLHRHPLITKSAFLLQKHIPCLVIIWKRIFWHGKKFSRHAVTNWRGDVSIK
ncbi:uncharacterized protein TM35_000074290 [Trypanosoma theileri]|uniref:Uncharacterized protein n=1 Tax=Trypanosoma theileri TaxID=67003 RepID=A0A1X0P280_9TRYP|nr:uncharacterized protein TM35_000074290 [Trypanosoma theileri]ORC91005.1 hypothetical protein TM35_000074290 [Trypanosoma theileri]